jgi:hypothetical protein
MDEARELYTLKEGTAILKEYIIPATNRHLFEVKDLFIRSFVKDDWAHHE